MTKTLTGIRGALLTGLAWAVVWAPAAVLVGLLIVDPDNSSDEMWVAIGAYPGFLCGMLFSVLAGRRRAPGELPLSWAGAWGALAGLLVGALPFTIGESSSELLLWQLAARVVGAITLMSALSAVGTAWLLRHFGRRQAGFSPL